MKRQCVAVVAVCFTFNHHARKRSVWCECEIDTHFLHFVTSSYTACCWVVSQAVSWLSDWLTDLKKTYIDRITCAARGSYTFTHYNVLCAFAKWANANFRVNDCRWLYYTQTTMVMTTTAAVTAATAVIMIIVNNMLLIVRCRCSYIAFHCTAIVQFVSWSTKYDRSEWSRRRRRKNETLEQSIRKLCKQE